MHNIVGRMLRRIPFPSARPIVALLRSRPITDPRSPSDQNAVHSTAVAKERGHVSVAPL